MNRFVTRLLELPLFPILMAVFIILRIEQQFGEIFTYSVVLKPVLFILLFPLVLIVVFYPIFKNIHKAALLSFVISFIVYFGSELKYFFMLHYPKTILGKYVLLLPFYLCLIGLAFYFVWKSKRIFTQLIRYLNIIFILFIVYEGVQMLSKNFSAKSGEINPTLFANTCDTCNYPNIYYIVLDGYSSGKILKSAFDFDNTAMENYLNERQFKVLDNSTSNYNLTSYSIAATFNMDYSKEVNKDVFLLQDYTKGVRTIYHNQLFPAMKQAGYEVNNLSFFSIKDTEKIAADFDLFNMSHLFLRYNLFYQVYQDLDMHFADAIVGSKKEMETFLAQKDNYNSTLFTILKKRIAQQKGKPNFHYIHYYTPHAPYTRDSLGNPTTLTAQKNKTEAQQYIDQIKYTNLLIKENISSILQMDQKEKIIILQADHGFRFDNPEKYADEFPNFCAVYFTKNNLLQNIPEDMSNVNTFRYINNLFFEKKMSILESRQFALKYKTKEFH